MPVCKLITVRLWRHLNCSGTWIITETDEKRSGCVERTIALLNAKRLLGFKSSRLSHDRLPNTDNLIVIACSLTLNFLARFVTCSSFRFSLPISLILANTIQDGISKAAAN